MSRAREKTVQVKELEQFKDDALNLLVVAMKNSCHKIGGGKYKGYFDTLNGSDLVTLGDFLVKHGKMERHTDGYGRRWFYRET